MSTVNLKDVAVHGALGAAQLEVQRLEAEVDRLNRAITRVLVLIAPETQMAQPIHGVRTFWASDIRAALEDPS